MSLKKKIVIILTGGILVSLILGFLFLYLIISTRFNSIETSVAKERSEDRVSIIKNGFDSVNTVISDWGGWDDTYNYVIDKNPKYIESNLYDGEYPVLKVNIVVLADSNNKTVYYGSRDYQNDAEFKNDDEAKGIVENILSSIKFSSIHDVVYGYVGQENFYYFAAHQILPSNVEANTKPNGTIIFLKQLDKANPENFGITIPQHSTVQILSSKDIVNLGLNNSQIEELETQGKYIKNKEGENISIFNLIMDFKGEPLFILKIDSVRIYSEEAISAMFSVYAILIGILGLLSVIFFFIIEKNLFSKLSTITLFIEQISDPLNTKERLNEDLGEDLNKLKTTVNTLLDKVQEQKGELDRVNNEFKKQNDALLIRQKELDERNHELNSLNQTMVGREMRMIELKNQVEDLSKKVNDIAK